MTDRELLAEYVKHKDQQAFARLVELHIDWVHCCARRLVREASLADDVVQAVFILLAQKAAGLDRQSHLAGWLFRTTRYCAAEALRSQARRQRHEREAAMQRTTVIDQPRWDDLAPELDEAVGQLSSADRDAVLLRFYQGLSLAEVGVAMGTSEEAARKRLARAMDRLRATLAGKGIAACVGGLGVVMAANVSQAAPAGLAQATVAMAHGAASTSASTLAGSVAKTLFWAKLKIAAAVAIVATGVTGATVVGISASSSARTTPAGTPAAQIAAGPVAAAQMVDQSEAARAGVPTVFSYHLLLDAKAADALKAAGQAEASDSKGYAALRIAPSVLHRALIDAQARKVLFAVEPDSMTTPSLTSPIQLIQGGSTVPMSLNWRSEVGDGVLRDSRLQINGGFQWLDRRKDACLLRLVGGEVVWTASARRQADGASRGSFTHTGSLSYQGRLAPGEAMVFISYAEQLDGRTVVHIRTFETARCDDSNDRYLWALDRNTSSWISDGPAGLRNIARQARVWESLAKGDADTISKGWERDLGNGESLSLWFVANPSRWMGCLWDAQGEPARYVAGFLAPDTPQGYRSVVLKLQLPRRPADSPYLFGGAAEKTTTKAILLPAGKRQVTVGIGTGPWQDLGRIEVHGDPLAFGEESEIEMSSVSQDANYIIPTLRCSHPTDVEWMKVVVKKDGTKVFEQGSPGAIVERGDINPQQQQMLNGPLSVKPKDFDHLEIRWRPRKWITFDGFALDPKQAPPENVTDAQLAEADRRLFDMDDQKIQASLAAWRTIPADRTTPKGTMRAVVAAADAGDLKAVQGFLEPQSDDKGKRLNELVSELLVSQQRLPHLLEKQFGRQVTQRTFMGQGRAMEEQLATWDWGEEGTEIAVPTGCLLHKQGDGTWRLALQPGMLQTPPEMVSGTMGLVRGIVAALEDGSCRTVEQVQERFGKAMIDMLDQMAGQAARPATRPATTQPS